MVRNILRDGAVLSINDVLASPNKEYEAKIAHQLWSKNRGLLEVSHNSINTPRNGEVLWAEGKKINKNIPEDYYLFCLYVSGRIQIYCNKFSTGINTLSNMSSRNPNPLDKNHPLHTEYTSNFTTLLQTSYLISETHLFDKSNVTELKSWLEVRDDGNLAACYVDDNNQVVTLWTSLNHLTGKKREKKMLRNREVLLPGEYLVTESSHHYLILDRDKEDSEPILRVYEGFPPQIPYRILWTGMLINSRAKSFNYEHLFLVNEFGVLEIFGTNNTELIREFASIKYDPMDPVYVKRLNLELLSREFSELLFKIPIDVKEPISGMSNTFKLQDDGNFVLFGRREGEAINRPVWSSLVNIHKPKAPEIENKISLWLALVAYEHMKIGESRILLYFGGEKYVLIDESPDDKTNSTQIANASGGIKITKNFIAPSFAIIAKGSLFDVATTNSVKDIAAVDFSLLNLEAQAQIGTYIGAGVGFSFIEGSVSIANIKLGISLETGIGIKDDSLTVKLLGVGWQVGRVWSISVFGSSFGLDFGRLYNTIME